MNPIKTILLLIALQLAFLQGIAQEAADLRLLFVGNSLTYTNDLPALVEKAARKNGLDVETKMIAYPNYALMDHWDDGDIKQEIRLNDYDVVIVQQGPSSQTEGRRLLLEYGEKISDLCKKYDSQMAYFMVWPSQTWYNTFDGVIASYREAAELHDALLLPVGEAWKAHFDDSGKFDYYGHDGFHPSIKGSKAAADIIAAHLQEVYSSAD